MKKLFFLLSVVAIACFLLASCGVSKEDIQSQVKTQLQSKLDTSSEYQKYKMRVDSVIVVSSGGNGYEGMAKVILRGKEYDVPLTVTVDSNSLMWQTKPLAFAFLAQY